MVAEHVSKVQVGKCCFIDSLVFIDYLFLLVYQNHKGEFTVSRNLEGFPCPCCKKDFKTAKTLKDHLAKKQLKCVYIYDSMTDAAH